MLVTVRVAGNMSLTFGLVCALDKRYELSYKSCYNNLKKNRLSCPIVMNPLEHSPNIMVIIRILIKCSIYVLSKNIQINLQFTLI